MRETSRKTQTIIVSILGAHPVTVYVYRRCVCTGMIYVKGEFVLKRTAFFYRILRIPCMRFLQLKKF